jgi:signal transduction histidine kinase
VLRSAATTAPEHGASTSGPKRILAVDDSPAYLASLSALLRDEGYDVVQARSGEEALELLALQGMDCILLDLMMPGMSGRETCRLIKAAPLVRDIPLIMVTGLDDRAAMLDALEAGADDYIQKSAEFEVLKARMRAQLRRKQFEDDNRRIRMELLNVEIEAAEARAARALAASRAELLAELEQKNGALELSNKELASANRAKSEFLSTMSHELRTPHNAIIGFSEILKEGMSGALTPRQREFTRHINDSGKHLLALINDILDLSKIEAGKLDIDLEAVDLDSALNDALTVVRERAQARQIALDANISGLQAPLQADRRRLKQIFYNLLSNAVKFSPDGGRVSVRATVVGRAQASDALPGFANGLRMPLPASAFERFVQISVQDKGIGLSMKDMEKLFKPFAQIKNDVTRTVEGTGLGLVTVARLVDLHQGTVAVTSEPGQGSCFTFWLPWQGAEEAQAGQADDALAMVAGLPLALVVEDDAAAAALMREQLESVGFQVRHAGSAEAALLLVDDYRPDLITLDIRLPGMDGWEFLCRIQNLPSWADVPVVVVSVDDEHEVGLSLGASSVLQKPISRADFVGELDQLGFTPTPTREVRVLVIDDNPGQPELLNSVLAKPGYAVSRASGGHEGIELTRRDLPDLVVLDLMMSHTGGIEVVEALKGDERTARIPVIMLAAKQFSEADRQQLNAQVQSVVDKAGAQPDRFLREVRRAFGRSTRVQ